MSNGVFVITRKPGEGITMTVPPSDTTTEIHLEAREHNHTRQVKLAFKAPNAVNIARDELLQRDEWEDR